MMALPRRDLVTGSLLFLLAASILLFVRLLPLSSGPGWPGPDLLLALSLVWVLRRPDQLAAPVIVLAVLIEDVLLMRPLGLWPMIVLLGTEAARTREHRWRDQGFLVEWLRAAVLIAAMILGYRLVQILFILPVPALGQAMLQVVATVAFYPLVVLAARWLLGLRRPGRPD
ncbi:rod shape-determining protein MreD [Paracoccus bogoriensis]|uniref:rod shape-determining protein MreD n=1 Tax=Paracoccus bogoriensis TaxID=242065 RepID=UPI001CA5C5B5|nr:rod shape-determining protein MreD [Paracoccus bogoriensis]MBW7056826.1 rod shape-determining protein MreD [Paracoccus bogoriensis]